MSKRIHYIIMTITLVLALVCAALMPLVNVNSDMTKYLPNGSQMKRGYEVVSSEFGAASLSQADVKVMFGGLTADEQAAMQDSLSLRPEVSKCSHKLSADGKHTLYELVVDKAFDQKKLGKQIRRSYDKVEVVETSQDGATPPMSVMVIAAVLIIAILLLMCQSWVEPFIYLATTGMAILLNMGTNALLPSVSITTHSIAAILQLVLSLDYCIVLTNRYRQELKGRLSDSSKDLSIVKVEAANAAIKRAFAPIMSSAMTTVVGLLMLCFMRLRIGIDMGVVLAKGVVFSLVCTFAVLPSLLMMLQKAIEKSHKKTFVIPTTRLGRFATGHKLPIAIFALVLFGVSFFFSQRTNIFFSANTESKIAKVFPPTNPFVIIYDTQDEEQIIPLADSIEQLPGVVSIISYPTLLQQQYSADQMAQHLATMGEELGDMMPASEQTSMLTPELMRIVYAMRAGCADTLQLDFPTLTLFIREHCLENPLFAGMIDDDMRAQMQLLDLMTGTDTPSSDAPSAASASTDTAAELLGDTAAELLADDGTSTPLAPTSTDASLASKTSASQDASAATKTSQDASASSASSSASSASSAASSDASKALAHDTIQPIENNGSAVLPVASASEDHPAVHIAEPQTYSLVDFIHKLYAAEPTALTMDFRTLADTVTLHRVMGIQEMAAYIGSSVTQTRLVFNYDKQKRKAMTPIEYMHILTDDLFARKELNGLINTEQKSLVRMRTGIMDLTLRDAQLTAPQITKIANTFGITSVDAARVKTIMGSCQKDEPQPLDLLASASSSTSSSTSSASSSTSASSSSSSASTSSASTASSSDTLALATQAPAAEKAVSSPEKGTTAERTPQAEKATQASAASQSERAAEPALGAASIAARSVHQPTAAEQEADRKAELFLELMFGGKRYSSEQMARHFSTLGHPVEAPMVSLLYTYYYSVEMLPDSSLMTIEQLFNFIYDELLHDPRLESLIDPAMRETMASAKTQLQDGVGMLTGEKHSLLVCLTNLPVESKATYAFTDALQGLTREGLDHECFMVGESVMYSEMKAGFSREMMIVTILTILAIFLIVAITFRSIVVPTILVMTVMTAVYVNVCFCGIVSGEMLYLAYLIVQSILMGATIDYGILFANYYKEKRKTLPAKEAVQEAYHGSIRTIMTSGLIMVFAPGAMALLTDNVMIRNIVGCLAIGAFVAIVLILVVLPGILVVFDKWVVQDAVPKRRSNG